MKQIISVFMLCFVSITFVFSQEYIVENSNVVMEKVIPTEMTMEQAHDALETFFASAYGDSNHTNKLNTPNHLVYIGIYKNIASYGTGIWHLHAKHNIDVFLKEGRCKIKVSCDVVEMDNTQNPTRYSYKVADYVPFTEVYKMSTGAPKSTVIKAGLELVQRMNNTIKAIEDVLQQKPAEEEDW